MKEIQAVEKVKKERKREAFLCVYQVYIMVYRFLLK